MSRSLQICFSVSLVFVSIFVSRSSLAIPVEQVQEICACTNATNDHCITFLNSDPAFKSAPDTKALVPLVLTSLSDGQLKKSVDYVDSLVAKVASDSKLKTLYEGCAELYNDTSSLVRLALESAKVGNLTAVDENVADAEFDVDDCSIGPRELGVRDPSKLEDFNQGVKAILVIVECVMKFATKI